MQKNTCQSNLHAIDQANKKKVDELYASGVIGTTCARHAFNQKVGFCNLQKGEK